MRNWDRIRRDLPVEVQLQLSKSAQGTKYSKIFCCNDVSVQKTKFDSTINKYQNDLESSSSDESIQEEHSFSENESVDCSLSPNNCMEVDLLPRHGNKRRANDDSICSVGSTKKWQIPFKYMVFTF